MDFFVGQSKFLLATETFHGNTSDYPSPPNWVANDASIVLLEPITPGKLRCKATALKLGATDVAATVPNGPPSNALNVNVILGVDAITIGLDPNQEP